MANIKGTRTSENLLKAFAGESQARNRYSYASKVANKEGFIQISNIFHETAENERMHAKVFLRHLINNGMAGEMITISATYPAALDEGDTKKNLLWAADGEKEEWKEIYPLFAEIAEDEGFNDIAKSFRNIAKVEARHETRFRKLLENIVNQAVFSREEKVLWKCLECGYIHEGNRAPEICPSCAHPQGYYEIFTETY